MRRKADILVVDDDPYTRSFFENLASTGDYVVETLDRGQAAIRAIKASNYDLVLLDLRLPDITGLDVLKETRNVTDLPEVIMMTGFSTVESAVEAMKLGALDYIQKPFENIEEIKLLIEKAVEKKSIRDENTFLKRKIRDLAIGNTFISEDPKMKRVLDIVRKVAPLDNSVLITGESGTGKEVIANMVHENSPRANNKFLAVNCGALTENLLESTLFGHEKGAFTGAIRRHKGYFEVADEGTLFLDEIGEISQGSQVKLLRVLEEKSFQRVGGTEDVYSDVRIVAATNRDLNKEVEEGRFREDLFYRINVVAIDLPPLRDREIDLPLLIQHYFHKYNQKLNKNLSSITPDAMELLMNYNWPGNIRELRNVMERTVILEENETISPASLPEKISRAEKSQATYFDLPFSKSKDVFEEDYITHALKVHQGNILRASESTNIPRQNFYLKIKKYGIDPDRFRPT